jgi:hypothetical protein
VLGNERDLRRWLVVQSLADSQSYASQNLAAWHTLERIWRLYVRSPFERSDLIRTISHYRRGRIAVALAAESGDATLARAAERHARVLSRLGHAHASSAACGIRAALASQRGDLNETRSLLAARRAQRERPARY